MRALRYAPISAVPTAPAPTVAHDHPSPLDQLSPTIIDDPTHEAADLAERLVDEVATPNQDWPTIRALAAQLADLGDRVTRTDEPGGEQA
jgi:hypothetical protein